MRTFRLAFAVVALLALGGQAGWAQPQQTIRIIIPFPPGGATDIVGRLLADQISRTQGVSAIVENRPGAGSVIGTEAVARAAPDGNTLLMPANFFVINRIVHKLSYDPLSFEPICVLVRAAHVVTVNSTSPYRTLGDYLAAARAQPGALTNASVGPATAQHIALEMLKRAANVDITFVPFSGNVPAINALLGGHVTSAIVNYPEVAEQVKSGKLRALATTLLARPKRHRTCRPSPNPVSPSSKPRPGLALSRRQRRGKVPRLSLPLGPSPPCRSPRSRPSCLQWACLRSGCAAPILPPIFASSMTNTIASSVLPISR